MALEWRDLLYLLMGFVAIGLVISFSAYEITTYGAVRDIVGGVAQQPSEIVSLHTQYGDMVDQFNNNGGDTFTYHWGSQAIPVTGSRVQGQDEQQTLGVVLDQYARNIYGGQVTGDLATASNIAGSGANGFYLITAFLLFVVLSAILILSYVQQWYETPKDMLKSAGKMILVIGILAFIVFLIAPPIIESIMWLSINGSDWSREVNAIVEPRLASTIQINTLIIVLFGALLYAGGFLIHINATEGEDVPDVMRYVREAPRVRETTKNPPKRTADKSPPNKPGHRQL